MVGHGRGRKKIYEIRTRPEENQAKPNIWPTDS